MGVTESFRHHRFAGRALVGEKYPEIFLRLGAADRYQCLPKPRGVALLGLAAGVEACSDLPPARSRQVGSVDDLALDHSDGSAGSTSSAAEICAAAASALPALSVHAMK